MFNSSDHPRLFSLASVAQSSIHTPHTHHFDEPHFTPTLSPLHHTSHPTPSPTAQGSGTGTLIHHPNISPHFYLHLHLPLHFISTSFYFHILSNFSKRNETIDRYPISASLTHHASITSYHTTHLFTQKKKKQKQTKRNETMEVPLRHHWDA